MSGNQRKITLLLQQITLFFDKKRKAKANQPVSSLFDLNIGLHHTEINRQREFGILQIGER